MEVVLTIKHILMKFICFFKFFVHLTHYKYINLIILTDKPVVFKIFHKIIQMRYRFGTPKTIDKYKKSFQQHMVF